MKKLRIISVFLWIGFVSAISFLEAWLKFTASGITLADGLAIGQIVFNALNNVELLLAFLIAVSCVHESLKTFLDPFVWIPWMLLLVQTCYLLPELSQRIDIYLQGGTPGPSHLHQVYVVFEVFKVALLLIYGIKQLNLYGIVKTNTR
jgi:hypothetical protein